LAFGAAPSISVYQWGGLSLTEVVHEASAEFTLSVSAESIGIVLNGELRALNSKIVIQKGGVLFFHSGKHRLIGPFRIFIGSYY
jgi:hypothetical protein